MTAGSTNHRPAFRIGFALALCCALALSGRAQEPAPSTQEQPTVRVNVSRVNVGVTVQDSHGRFLEGLSREDFRVFDNGVEQKITGFLSVEEPAQVVFLIESGPAVYFLGKNHLRAASKLLGALAPDDRVAIATYSKDAYLNLEFTTDKFSAQFTLDHINFNVGFGDLNLSASIATTLDWLSAVPGKKTIVLLSSGVDTSGPEHWQEIQQKLKTSDVRILAVSLVGDLNKPARGRKLSSQERSERSSVKQGFAQADQSLREISSTTGGKVFFAKNDKEFDKAYEEIAQLVRHEYSLAFAPLMLDGKLHSINVTVKNPSYQVDHRQAYLAPSAEN